MHEQKLAFFVVVFKTANNPPLDVQSIYNLVHTNGNDHNNRRLSAGYRYDIALTKLAGEKAFKNAPKSAADLLVAFKTEHETCLEF